MLFGLYIISLHAPISLIIIIMEKSKANQSIQSIDYDSIQW